MIKIVIVDDEPNVGEELKRMLETSYADMQVMAICYNFKEIEDAINQHQPDLVFLDIELGNGLNSFEILNKISPINFRIIFTTAHNQYAIQAIKFSAIDYLLKPIDEEELKTAIARFRNKKYKADSGKVESLISALVNPGSQQNKLHLITKSGYEIVVVADIIYCQASGNHSLLVLTGNREINITMPLRQLENLLLPYRFTRIHQSCLINLNHLKKYTKGKDGVALVSNDTNLTISRNFKEKFLEKLRAI